MPETLGARLRRHREERQIDLRTIAEQSKIKLALLEGLERDDVSHWPAGIYRRAYLRTYAHAIGLDPDPLIREFVELHPDPEDLNAALANAAAEPLRSQSGAPARLRSMMGSALGSLTRLRGTPSPELAVQTPRAGERAMSPAPERPITPAPARSTASETEPVAANHASPETVATDPVAAEPPAPEPARQPGPGVDFERLAQLSTAVARVESATELEALLGTAADLLDATGIIVWIWDGEAGGLRAVMVHGYSQNLVAHLPPVARDADNATAEAFRTLQPCSVGGSADANAALVVPLLAAGGCAGVLAFELPDGREQVPQVRAAAVILAALLAQLTGRARATDAQAPRDLAVPAGGVR